MAEIKSPISGGLQVARRTVSADAFVRSAPAPAQPDPVTTTLIERNSLILNTVSGQLASLSQQVNSLNVAMQNIYTNISSASALERRQNIQEQNQERRLAEQQLREGKESIVERKIQNALVYPVQKVAAKASFTLSRVMAFFTTLLGGWLLNQGIQTIKAFSEDNKKKLNDIKNNVLKNLGSIGGIYTAIREGLTNTFDIITKVASRISSAVSVNLFMKPVEALINGIKGAANKFKSFFNKIKSFFNKNKPEPTTPASTTPPPTTPSTSDTSQSTPSASSSGTTDTMQAVDSAKLYDSFSVDVNNLASNVPGLSWIKGMGDLTSGFASFAPLTDLNNLSFDKIGEMLSGSSDSSMINNNLLSQPLQSKVTDIAFGSDSEKTTDAMASAEEQDFTQPAMYGEINVAQLTGESLAKEMTQMSDVLMGKEKPPEAQIMPIKPETKMKMESVGPLPEPAPTFIPMPLISQQPTPQAPGPNQSSEPATTVPSINPENPNNKLYLLHSHSVYNVPIA